MMQVSFGVDRILAQHPSWKNESLGLLTNHAATTREGTPAREAMLRHGFSIQVLFSPEHGLDVQGADGAAMEDGKDWLTGLPVKSLYRQSFAPDLEDLRGLDRIIFDVPDVGARFYTYLWSMTYWIEAAAKLNKMVVILDRPNPLGGNQSIIEGPMLDENITSFIGRLNIPVKHQCTLGELALYFNATQNWNANISVIACEGWKREHLFYDWIMKWVNPSPALQNFEATLLYPGLCFFEATNVSVGRGSNYSFEWIGAEWMNIPAMLLVGKNIMKEDLKIENLSLPITIDGNTNETKGIRIKIIEPKFYSAVINGLILLKLVKDIHPNEFKWMPYKTNANPTGENHLSLLLGIPNAEAIFDLPLQQWLQKINTLVKVGQWRNEIMPYLLYK